MRKLHPSKLTRNRLEMRLTRLLRSNSSGYTLMELTIAMAIFAVGLYVTPDILRHYQSMEKNMEKYMATDSTSKLVRYILDDKQRCSEALSNQNFEHSIRLNRRAGGNGQQAVLLPGREIGSGWRIRDIYFDGMEHDSYAAIDSLESTNTFAVAGAPTHNFRIDLSEFNDPHYLTFNDGVWEERDPSTNNLVKRWDNENEYFSFGPVGSEVQTPYFPRYKLIFHHSGQYFKPGGAAAGETTPWSDVWESVPMQLRSTNLNFRYAKGPVQQNASLTLGRDEVVESFPVEIATAGPNIMYCTSKTGQSESFEMTACNHSGGFWNAYAQHCDMTFQRERERVASCLQYGAFHGNVDINGSVVTKCLSMFSANCYRDYFKGILTRYEGSWPQILALSANELLEFEALQGFAQGQGCSSFGL